MPEPTRCPTCGHPVTIPDGDRAHWSGVPQDYATQAIPPEYRPTAPDPASVAKMRKLLGEIRAAFDGEDGNVAMSEETYQPWCDSIDVLLGPAATEEGG